MALVSIVILKWQYRSALVELQVRQTSGFKKWVFDKASVSVHCFLSTSFIKNVYCTVLELSDHSIRVFYELYSEVGVCSIRVIDIVQITMY